MIVPDDDAMKELDETGEWVYLPATCDIVCHVSASLSKPNQTPENFKRNMDWLYEAEGLHYQ